LAPASEKQERISKNFRTVVNVAARLTDKQKKKIIADYIAVESYNAVAKMNGVSKDSVKRVVLSCADFDRFAKQKKEQNTADIISYMESQRDDVCDVLRICLSELKKPGKYEKVQPQQIATTMAILIDKYTAISGGSGYSLEEDKLSKSLREMGKELESDG